jgi:hypothetical protein
MPCSLVDGTCLPTFSRATSNFRMRVSRFREVKVRYMDRRRGHVSANYSSTTVKTGKTRPSETPVSFYQVTRRHIPEHGHP